MDILISVIAKDDEGFFSSVDKSHVALHFSYHVFFHCSLVRRYDEMADKVSEMPEDTEALVALQNYLRTVTYCNT